MLIATKGGKINISEEKNTKSVAEKFSKLIKQGDFIPVSYTHLRAHETS